MHKFDSHDVQGFITDSMLANLNVTMPNNDGEYPSREEFIHADNVAQDTARNILLTVEHIIDNNELPNIQMDV